MVTVTYNAASTVRRTMDSVSEQTYEAVEHLIVDGCSQDGTMEEVQRYVERNTDHSHPHQIRLIREPDRGIYDAMNKGIHGAKGDYIVFLNAGDTFHDANVLEKVASVAMRFPESRRPAIIYGETDLVDDEGRFLRHRRLSVPQKLNSSSFLWGMVVCHQSFYVRADLARLEDYDLRYRFSADYDWCIRVMRRAERRGLGMVNAEGILTNYLSEGMTTHNHKESLKERLYAMAYHYGWPWALMAHAWFVLRALVKK